jgi:hypothetical protein
LEKIGVLKKMVEDLECGRGFEEGLERLVWGRYHFEQVYGGMFFNEWGMFLCCGLCFLVVLT